MIRKLVCFILLACAGALLAAVPLRIFHTNDTHGAYQARNWGSGETARPLGGYVALEAHLNRLRAEAGRSIYLDAGDQQTGTVFAALDHNGAVGGAVIEVFNHLGLDASTYGNHEFDHSLDNLDRLRALADYPFVSTNVIVSRTALPYGGTPTRIIELDSLKVGIMGLTLTDLGEKVKIENVKDLFVRDYTFALDEYLDDLDRATDLIILLTHNGFEADSLLATMLDGRVDIIIGGHSHTYITGPRQVNGVYILQAGSYLSHLGYADIEVVDDRIATFDSRLVPLTLDFAPADTHISRFVDQKARQIEAELGKVIGKVPVEWVPDKFTETEVSVWMAKALQAEFYDPYMPHIAIINNGGIRKRVPAGEITLRDMHEVLPFNNSVVLFSCYGRDLLAFQDLNEMTRMMRPYDICSISVPGWQPEYCKHWDDCDHGWFDMGGYPLEEDVVYRVVSHDYVLGQWDKYLGFKPFDAYDTGILFLDAMISQVKKQFPLKD